VLPVGLALTAVSFVLFARLPVEGNYFTDLFPGFLISGLGLAVVFVPMSIGALTGVRPADAGVASGLLNTSTQVGGAIGSAVIGAVLQNRLATQLQEQAVAYSGQVPPAFRSSFINGFSHAASGGFKVGVGQTGGAQLPAGIPPSLAPTLQRLFHDVFANAYVNAVKPTLAVSIAVLAVGALSCLLIEGQAKATARADAAEQGAAAAAS